MKNRLYQKTNTAVADSVQPIKITTETGTPALNPPHGQPNHRCDIAVGAPLNSPSNQNQNQPIQIQPVQTQQAPVGVTNTNPANVKPKLNPPHGQPHHRCELAVGAPLPNV